MMTNKFKSRCCQHRSDLSLPVITIKLTINPLSNTHVADTALSQQMLSIPESSVALPSVTRASKRGLREAPPHSEDSRELRDGVVVRSLMMSTMRITISLL